MVEQPFRDRRKGRRSVVAWLRAVAVGIVSTLTACNGDGAPPEDREPVGGFGVTTRIEAVWSGRDEFSDDPRAEVTEPERLRIYLDISSPMAGFIPLGAATTDDPVADPSEFRTVAQWVPDHLGRVYAGALLEWRGFAQGVENLPQDMRLGRDLFSGTASNIGTAIREILADFRAGRAEGAAIITDLVGTGASTGAREVAGHLAAWLESPQVRSGDFHLGLIGVKATYWGGVHSTICPARDGLGCWFSERMNGGRGGWKRLDAPAVVPFYILLAGRGADEIEDVATAILQDARDWGIQPENTAWELLTSASVRRTANAACTAFPEGRPGDDQYALWRDSTTSHYGCFRRDRVALSCTFEGEVQPTEVSLADQAAGVSPFTVGVSADELAVTVDCGVIGAGNHGTQDLLLDVTGPYALPPNRPPWEDDWHTPTDDLPRHPGKTLQLRYFVEDTRVKPESYRFVLPPLLRGDSR